MKKRILVIDDESDFTSLLKLTLETEGYYEVLEENDASNAVAAARDFFPDLILLDIMMPDLDGSEVASRVRAEPMLRDVPVLFMTALVSETDAPQGGAYTSGGQTFLPKTTPVERLMRHIEDKIIRRTPVPA